MASPTIAELNTILTNSLKIPKDLKTSFDTFLTNLDTLQQSVEGDHSSELLSSFESLRSSLSSSLIQPANALQSLFLDYAKLIGSPQSDVATLLDHVDGDLFLYFHNNGQRVNSREIVYGSPSAGGGNTGNGLLYRLTKDRLAYNIERCSLTSKKAECLRDSNLGVKIGEEVFSLFHEVSSKDELDASAFSNNTSITAKSPENGILSNASFESIDGTVGAGGLNSIPSWTLPNSDIANFEYDSTNYYAQSHTERVNGTAYSLKIKANTKIIQRLRDIGKSINQDVPYYLLVHYNREVGAGDGILTIRMGSNSASVTLSTQVGWNVLALTLDENLWPQNFYEDDIDIEIELSGRTTGYVLVDWVVFDEMTFFDGSWYFLKAGSTPFRKGDVFTWSDSLTATEGIVQYWIQRLFGVYFPHTTGGTETVIDP